MDSSEFLKERYSSQLTSQEKLDFYWYMVLSRRLDERAWLLHRQGKIVFHISAIGHEACQVAAGFAINRGVDYFYPYYRDLTLSLVIGISPHQVMLSLYGKDGDTASRGRQMPAHFSDSSLNIVSGSSAVASQVPHAAGAAFAIQYKQKTNMVSADDTSQPRLALTCLGEGSTSQGDWHEAMNWAGLKNLPFICLVQNNQYAISVPYEKQAALPNVADRAPGFGVVGVTADGNDVLEMYDVMKAAVERAYQGEGATLVEAITYRPVPHSSDDDDRTYRSRAEVEAWKKKDPIQRYQNVLIEEGILDEATIKEVNASALAQVDEAHRAAEDAPYPPLESMFDHIYAPAEDD